MTFSYFSSPFTTVKDAVASGKCTLITNAVVSHVDMDNALNKAQGVTYVDRLTRQVKEVRGKAVVMCAQALESTRILLNSSTREYPKGLANSSGLLGHYLMDHVVGGGASATFDDMKALPTANPPHRPTGIYLVPFRNTPATGNDPKKSVLNTFCQSHDVSNLLVTDGSGFVSSACQNPTLTMMAITVRACDHLVERFRRNEI